MTYATFRFYGDLDHFLPSWQRETEIRYRLDGAPAVKHPIEALGIPHPEVELILIDGRSVGFEHIIRPGDHIDVYPLGYPVAVVERPALRPPLPHPLRFVVDTHLGQLASYLRLFGFDTRYRNEADDAELAQLASAEERLLLTRDRGLLKRKLVVFGYCVRESNPRLQLQTVLRRYRLHDQIDLWRRCVHCNGLLDPVDKAAILDRLEPKTRLYYERFERCRECGQIYWQGSHWERMQGFIREVLDTIEDGG